MSADGSTNPEATAEFKRVGSPISQPHHDDISCKLLPQEALGVLKDGNCKYRMKNSPLDVGVWDPEGKAPVQSPIAVIVCCSDSRVPPELVFWQGLGRLFVTRVAGNTVDAAALGSIAYAVKTFETSLIVVLGHEHCGAVRAAVDSVKCGVTYSPIMDGILKPILPAVEKVINTHPKCSDLYEATMWENVKLTVEGLSKNLSSFLEDLIEPDHLWIIGARYDVNTGAVKFLEHVPLKCGVVS